MKNSLVDREDDDFARPIGFVTDVQRFARFCGRDCVDVDVKPAFFFIGGEMNDTVTERADENFLRVECAHERNIDVTAAFEIFRNANVLDAARGVGLEPLLCVNMVALDRNQTVAGIRRGDADRDFVAAIVLRAVEFHVELRIFLERTRNRAVTDDAKLQLGQAPVLIVAQFENVIARFIGGQRVVKSIRGHGDLLRFRGAFF